MASLDTVPFVGPDAQFFTYVVGVPAAGLQAFSYGAPSGENSEASFTYLIETPDEFCWDPRAVRLLDYLGAPFRKVLSALLGFFMRTVARELTTCTEIVSFTHNTDVRAGLTFTVEVRFEPINAVTSVRRVDGGGALLEEYTVESYDGRVVTVSGVTTPKAGDTLTVSYSYTHQGLEYRVTQALSELNILTATGEFLDRWGGFFNVVRIPTGKYGSIVYGGAKYGTPGLESDNAYSRRIISTVTGGRNTKPAIVAAVQKLTGGAPYIVDWSSSLGHRGFVFRPAGDPAWMGEETEAGTLHHLIWGRTARFVTDGVTNGGAFVFEVWVPTGSGATTAGILAVVNALKPAGSRAIIRYF